MEGRHIAEHDVLTCLSHPIADSGTMGIHDIERKDRAT